MILLPEDAKDITGRRLAVSRADHCIVYLNGGSTINLRFARNNATSNGAQSKLSVTIISQFGQHSGSATVSSLDENALDGAQRRSEEIARHVPGDPEHMPPLGPQTYVPGIAFDAPTADIRPIQLAEAAHAAITQAGERQVDAAGYAAAGGQFRAVATSAGLFAYDRGTDALFTFTARRKDGRWSGWAGGSDFRFSEIDTNHIAGRAVAKATSSTPPRDLDPGQYTVILEPSAVGELLRFVTWSMDARAADEGRSWLSKKGGGTKLGEKLLDECVTLYSDPAEPLAPIPIFSREGVPQERTLWVEDGIVKNLAYSRYWAQKTGNKPRPWPTGIVMVGGSTTIDEMIRDTRRGILVTRIWYANMLDPRTLLVTGLTRDGNFLIEGGRIVGPACNFRFNESLIAMFRNIVARGPSERIYGGDLGGGPIAAPPLLVKTFTFSSRSNSI